jgi:hypothetical protein
MINDSFHKIEQTPAKDHRANKLCERRNRLTPVRRTPQHKHADECDKPDRCMKDSVPRHVEHHRFHCGWWIPVGDHVVPLHDLMKNYSVYEAA